MADRLEKLPWLHVYGQYSYHTEAVIRGTKEGLLALRDAIDGALNRAPADAEVYAADGEGYSAKVIMVNTHATLGRAEYIFEKEQALCRAKAERDREYRLLPRKARS